MGSSVLAQRRRTKAEVVEAYLRSLAARGDIDIAAPGLAASIRQHFAALPSRYALDVNLDSLDVLSHLKLLQGADAAAPAHARTLQAPTCTPAPHTQRRVRTPPAWLTLCGL
jgi:hypothetical protein